MNVIAHSPLASPAALHCASFPFPHAAADISRSASRAALRSALNHGIPHPHPNPHSYCHTPIPSSPLSSGGGVFHNHTIRHTEDFTPRNSAFNLVFAPKLGRIRSNSTSQIIEALPRDPAPSFKANPPQLVAPKPTRRRAVSFMESGSRAERPLEERFGDMEMKDGELPAMETAKTNYNSRYRVPTPYPRASLGNLDSLGESLSADGSL